MFPKLAAKASRNGGALLIWYGSRYSKTSERNGHGPSFYTVVATMIAMAILYLSVSFSSVQRQSAAIRSFIRQNVVMFQMKTVQMEPNPEGAASPNKTAAKARRCFGLFAA